MEPSSDLATVELAPLPPLPAGTTRADFCIGRYCIAAEVHTGDRRLLDVLRDNTRHYLEVRRLGIRPVENPELRSDYTDGLLNKTDIEWAAVRAEPSRSESRLYGFVKKTPVRVAFVLGSYCVEGNVFVDSSGTDANLFFLRGVEKSGDRFLAVGSATISSAAGTSDEASLVIVNRSAVKLFSVVR